MSEDIVTPEQEAEWEAEAVAWRARLAALKAKGWREVSCGCCGGLQWGGEEPRECLDCNASGTYWVTPGGRTALYPGGPFTGRLPATMRKRQEMPA